MTKNVYLNFLLFFYRVIQRSVIKKYVPNQKKKMYLFIVSFKSSCHKICDTNQSRKKTMIKNNDVFLERPKLMYTI